MHHAQSRHGTSIRTLKASCLTSVGFVALFAGAPVSAQAVVGDTTPAASTPAASPAANPAETGGVGDIVVTARRSQENAQHIPVSVQAVTGDQLQKLSITSVEEVSKLAPGLTLVNNGSSTEITLRGVTWEPGSGTPATPVYLNEAPFDPGNTIVSLFDVGQIEVLRGPQGTERGAPSISGAITITLRKPDLERFGGFVQGLYGSGNHKDLQAALNVPIIKDILAVRFATNVENSDFDRVRSVNSTINPRLRDRTYRGTILLKPTDTLSIQAMYQRRRTTTENFTQVEGTGSPGYAALGIPANFNGPALSVGDRKSVQDAPTDRPQAIDLLTINAKWQVLGQTLSYNYGRQFNRSPLVRNATDASNILPGYEAYTSVYNVGLPKFTTQEILLSSNPDPDRPFDYDAGWFSKHSSGNQGFDSPVFLPGAFGAPFATIPGQVQTPNPAYVLNSHLAIHIGQKFDSFHGNIRFHLGDHTELSGGLAIIRDRVPNTIGISTSSALVALPTFLPPPTGCLGVAAFLPVSQDYGPAYCQTTVPATVYPTQSTNKVYSKAIYNFSLSHRFGDDVLVYGTTGSSYRSGLASIGNFGLPNDLLVPKPESAKSYEIGVKTSIGRRLHINADVFQLNYSNQLTSRTGVIYRSTISGNPSASNVSFYSNIDARVRGAELEINAKPIDALSLAANFSYSRITSKGGILPCNNGSITQANPNGDLTAANPIDFCNSPKGQVINQEAPFQATFNGDYEIPITDRLGGYFRFNVNVHGKNPNFGNYILADGSYTKTPAYALVDLFAGITGNHNGWDLGVYAKNVFDKQQELTRVLIASPFPLFAAPAGYDAIRTTLPREVGVTLRYSFGSR